MSYMYVVCTYYLLFQNIGSISMGHINTESYFPFLFIDLNCTGDEESIFNCPSNALIHYTCPYNHDAAVACHGIRNTSLTLMLDCLFVMYV